MLAVRSGANLQLNIAVRAKIPAPQSETFLIIVLLVSAKYCSMRPSNPAAYSIQKACQFVFRVALSTPSQLLLLQGASDFNFLMLICTLTLLTRGKGSSGIGLPRNYIVGQ